MASPRNILIARFALEDRLASAGSKTGQQCQMLANGQQPGGGNGSGVERIRIMLADLVLKTRDLTPEELHLCRLRYASTLGGVALYKRKIGIASLEDAERWQGEVLLPMERDADNPDLRTVQGVRARWADYRVIAKEAGGGLTARQVESRIKSALAKVRKREEAE